MAAWFLNLNIASAANIPDVREFGKMKVYARVSINGAEALTYTTPVDYAGKTNPRWNISMEYQNLAGAFIQNEQNYLVIRLYCERSFLEDKLVCSVQIPLITLFLANHGGGYVERNLGLFRVGDGGGQARGGMLKLWYCFGQMQPQASKVFEEGSRSDSSVMKVCKALADTIIPGASLIMDWLDE